MIREQPIGQLNLPEKAHGFSNLVWVVFHLWPHSWSESRHLSSLLIPLSPLQPLPPLHPSALNPRITFKLFSIFDLIFILVSAPLLSTHNPCFLNRRIPVYTVTPWLTGRESSRHLLCRMDIGCFGTSARMERLKPHSLKSLSRLVSHNSINHRVAATQSIVESLSVNTNLATDCHHTAALSTGGSTRGPACRNGWRNEVKLLLLKLDSDKDIQNRFVSSQKRRRRRRRGGFEWIEIYVHKNNVMKWCTKGWLWINNKCRYPFTLTHNRA